MEQIYSHGRRKTSVARIYLKKGEGTIVVNKEKNLKDYLVREDLVQRALMPLKTVALEHQFDLVITVKGGGISSQAGAISHGLARALLKYQDELREPLKKEGLLTRDSRMVERKKYGQKGARKQFQFSKR